MGSNIKNDVYKLLIIIPSLGFGGAENMVYELVKNLNRNKFEIKILCYQGRTGSIIESKLETICEVDYMGITGKITLFHLLQVMRTISCFLPDIVHAHLGGITFAIPWCTIHNIPLVLTVHTRPDKAFSKKNQNQIKRYLNSGLFTIVAVSEENFSLVKKFYNIFDSRIQYINNGVDLERFYRKPHELFTFINVARQDENKNQIAIIKAFRKICATERNCRLFLIGDGPCHIELTNQVKTFSLDDRIIMPGLIDSPETFYSISDVYVQASHREALPLSVLEAMAAGLPIVSTNVGGLNDVVKQNGILVADNDDNELYEAMKLMMNKTNDEYNFMSANSKRLSENYSSKTMANKYEQLYLFSIRKK